MISGHTYRPNGLGARDENGNVPCAQCGLPKGVHTDQGGGDAESRIAALERASVQAADRPVRDILEALCRRDGLSLESTVTPGEPARNYELASRLGIGHVFGLREQP
jgi:hypothetical protein